MLAAFPAKAGWVLQGAEPEQRLTPTCLVYPGYVVVLQADPEESGGEGVSVRPRAKNEELDASRSCGFNDTHAVLRTVPRGNSHFAGLIDNVLFIADEEIRTSLFAYALPSGKELFVARNWAEGRVDAKAKAVSFTVPAQAKSCETSVRAQGVQPGACKKRAEEALACLKDSNERFAKAKKPDLADGKKGGGKDCAFDLRERYRFDVEKKVLEPTGEVSGEISSTL